MIKKNIFMKQFFFVFVLTCMFALTGCFPIGGMGVMPGRPLHIQGKPVSAAVHLTEENSWANGQSPDTCGLDEATCSALEALWLSDARGEHASIPAFSRIAWQLAALGAPPELLEWAHKAALEEIHHTQLCFALAEGYGDCSYSIQPIPAMLEGGLDLKGDPITVMATETIFDGCLMEGFFANLAAVATHHCEESATLAALKQIAREEASHAAFSWAVLEWLFKQHPTKLGVVIQHAHHDLAAHRRPIAVSSEQKHLVEQANPELLIKYGRLPDEQWQQIWDNHLVNVRDDLQGLLKSNL